MKNRIYKRFKKNKYKIYLSLISLVLAIFLIIFVKNTISDYYLKKYDKEIIVIRDSDNIQHSYSLREIRSLKAIKQKVRINKGLEVVELTGVALEKLLGDLGYNLEEAPDLLIEDSNGNTTTFPMSVALEVNRVLLVYKINNKANRDYDDSMGTFSIIDTTSDNKSSWVKDAKLLNIQ